eukprot:gene21311-15795_t
MAPCFTELAAQAPVFNDFIIGNPGIVVGQSAFPAK